ncbi:MAG TPA: hypothetical protein PKW33_12370 [Anaerolineaceae bacterium]|nr:hypothetical protein [Anaerolineaceae bacterium]HPN52377.1 hypothetical protein [Anaerolineaceae bacterium]
MRCKWAGISAGTDSGSTLACGLAGNSVIFEEGAALGKFIEGNGDEACEPGRAFWGPGSDGWIGGWFSSVGEKKFADSLEASG